MPDRRGGPDPAPAPGPTGAGRVMPPRSRESRSEHRPRAPTLGSVITTTGLELRAGARILISDAALRVQPGDRIGLVGRNGAGKTTTLTTLAGGRLPPPGPGEGSGGVGDPPPGPRRGGAGLHAR